MAGRLMTPPHAAVGQVHELEGSLRMADRQGPVVGGELVGSPPSIQGADGLEGGKLPKGRLRSLRPPALCVAYRIPAVGRYGHRPPKPGVLFKRAEGLTPFKVPKLHGDRLLVRRFIRGERM